MFNGYYVQAKMNWGSGCGDEDIYDKADHLFYEATKRKNLFKYKKAWKKLIEIPKFVHIMNDDSWSEKRQKGNDGSSNLSRSAPEESFGFYDQCCPIGQKQAIRQERNKGKKLIDSEEPIDVDEMPEDVYNKLNNAADRVAMLVVEKAEYVRGKKINNYLKAKAIDTSNYSPEDLEEYNILLATLRSMFWIKSGFIIIELGCFVLCTLAILIQ